MFSFLMGNFIEILGTYKSLNSNFDDGDTLSKFFGTMKHFNHGDDMEDHLKRNIEDHFNYFWNNDKNQAFLTEAD